MTAAQSTMKMPELAVFARSLAIGFVGAELYRTAFYLGSRFAATLSDVPGWAKLCGILVVAAICLLYALERDVRAATARMVHSRRFDLLIALCIGVWANELISPRLGKLHEALRTADPHWAPAALGLLCTLLLSPMIRNFGKGSGTKVSQMYFIADDEIRDEREDLLGSGAQAISFAEAVLQSGAHPGLVFGVDGPWGVGKTSFINLAERHWVLAADRVIVCRFEPLRYASELDLADRIIRELSAAIQRQVFAPEFRPAASRYSRLIKGRADFSFFGFKMSLEPGHETVDELLDDVDEALKRIGRRVIIVIDDLDRLDPKAVNNVLFATRRTFKLSQATYVLCYDTEVLAGDKEEGSRAREFLEKFVTVKLSLFVDSSSIREFLRRDWQRSENQLGSVPSDTMLKLGAVFNELADILDGETASKYLPAVGDLRKVKRLVNAMLMMQLEKSNLGRTDFNIRDLLNLILLHLNYPGVFRRIYAEETDGRSGTFSIRREVGKTEFKNTDEFSVFVGGCQEMARLLLTQLFDVRELGLSIRNGVDEATLASRACFNHKSSRNLESYLKLIVRFAKPEPRETYILYKDAVERVRKGASTISTVLSSADFKLALGEHAHDQFWRVLVNQSQDLTQSVADHAIDSIIDFMPRYSTVENDDRGLRQRSVYSLLRLLDRVGWGRTSGRRLPNSPENIVEIAWRIFGERSHEGSGLIERLASDERGVLGWNDLMLFRLQCSADRQGQLHNLYSALVLHEDASSPTDGMVSRLAEIGMRRLSQRVFSLFQRTFIEPQRNFLSEVDDTRDEDFLGESPILTLRKKPVSGEVDEGSVPLSQRLCHARCSVKSFVIYQLSNPLPPKGSGVGCGFYDECGDADGGGIARLMNKYVFAICFNPKLGAENALHFLDHCLMHLSSSFLLGREDRGYFASKIELPGGLDPIEMGRYWIEHRDAIRQQALRAEDRVVVTGNYVASYRDDLADVFAVLDELAQDGLGGAAESEKPGPSL